MDVLSHGGEKFSDRDVGWIVTSFIVCDASPEIVQVCFTSEVGPCTVIR